MTSNVPEIRFHRFDGEWENKKFEQMLDAADGVRRGPFGSALKKDCFTEDGEYVVYEQHNAIYDEYKTRYRITKEKYMELKKFNLQPNDFIMSGAGTIGRISRVPFGIEKGVFNQALIRLRINSKLTDYEYFLQFIRAEFMQKKLTGANPGSAINNLVPMSEVKKWVITMPCLIEQQAIGSFFKELDDRIALQQTSLDNLKDAKKGFLQKMFPKTGETTPEIRFEGYDGEWEEKRLEDISKITMGQSPSSENYTNNPIDNILIQGNTDLKNGFVKPRVWTTDVTKTVESGDLIMSVRAPVGYMAKTNYPAVIGRGVCGIKGDEFLFQYLKRMKENGFWSRYSTGSTFESISSIDIKSASINTPYLINEQQAIGSFFKELDDTISLEERELELLKETKKAFLQKMFV